jgi:hypothetical protein
MFDEYSDIEILEKTIIAYKRYIDCHCDLNEVERSELLMVARALDGEAQLRGFHVVCAM